MRLFFLTANDAIRLLEIETLHEKGIFDDVLSRHCLAAERKKIKFSNI
jgi:hypothetical protein